MKISGIGFVYMITSPKGRVYVGSTVDVEKRWSCYKVLICKKQSKLYNSFKKYGVDNHIFEIVWAGDVIDMLRYEAMIGIYYQVLDSKFGLNCKLPRISECYKSVCPETIVKMSISARNGYLSGTRVHSRLGKSLSNETKLKIGSSNKGKKFSLQHRENLRKAHLGNIVSNKTKSKMRIAHLGRKKSKSHSLNIGLSHSKKVYQYTKKDQFIREWKSLTEAAAKLGISCSNISNCCSGKIKSVGGFKWKYTKI